jgi:peroxiredoxin
MKLRSLGYVISFTAAFWSTSALADAEQAASSVHVRLAPVDVRASVQGYTPTTTLAALIDEPFLPSDKLPDLEGKGHFGIIRLGPKSVPISIAVDESNSRYRVFVDTNADGSLKDERPWGWIEASREQPASGEAVIRTDELALRLQYSLAMDEQPYFKYSVVTARGGTLSTGGRRFRVMLVDGNNDGRYDSRESDKLLVDLNGDGILDGNPDSAELMPINRRFVLEGKTWSIAGVAADGSQLTLSEVPSDSKDVEEVTEEPEGKPVVGHFPPAFSETAIDGRKVILKDYRGKVVLLDFWATWCGPCRAERPSVLSAYQRYKDQDFAIIGISLDTNSGQLEAFVSALGVEWPQLLDGKDREFKLAELYNVSAIPAMFLIGKDGRIVATGLRGTALAPAIEKALKE